MEAGNHLYPENVEVIKKMLRHNRGYVFEIPREETVILLCSGGMDSVVLADKIVRDWDCKVIFLYFQREARNQAWEESAVDFFYEFYCQRWPNNVLELLKIPVEIPSRVNKEYMNRDRQAVMMLPMRNAVMWDMAFTQAVYLSEKYQTTIRSILVGSVKEDLSSPESGILAVLVENLHACSCLGIWYYQLLAPFIDGFDGVVWDKLALVRYATKWEIPLDRTRSCFDSKPEPCNECLACTNRNAAFKAFEQENEKSG